MGNQKFNILDIFNVFNMFNIKWSLSGNQTLNFL